MPLMLDNIRAEFARFLADDPTARWRMDSALAHVVTIAYERGLDDGRRGHDAPPGATDMLAEAINESWVRLYGGEVVSDIKALINRVHQIAADRDCWVATAKATEKDRLKLNDQLREKAQA